MSEKYKRAFAPLAGFFMVVGAIAIVSNLAIFFDVGAIFFFLVVCYVLAKAMK